jgi:hypothetical protein
LLNTYKSYSAEKVDIEDSAPFFWCKIDYSLHGSEDSMVDY